jgi:methionine synthase II (cobalamin-independent)
MTEMQQIREQLDEISFKLEGIEGTNSRMLNLLQGNPLDKDDKGMIGKVSTQGQKINKLEKLMDRGKYMLMGCAVGAGYGIKELIGLIFKH